MNLLLYVLICIWIPLALYAASYEGNELTEFTLTPFSFIVLFLILIAFLACVFRLERCPDE